MGWTMLATLAVLVSAAGAPLRQPLCEASAEVRRAIDEATPPGALEADFERASSSLRAVRERFPQDLFAHARYQDAVFDGGTEGHLKRMLREYQQLSAEHPQETLYEYLAGRARLGRGTKKAVRAMERILEREPAFAPALRTLAEIHGSAAFGDAAKERVEREAFAALCPGSQIARRPSPLPERSRLLGGAGFAGDGRSAERGASNADQREATAEEIGRALQADQARLMRIRLFDWYSEETKARELLDAQAECWKAWRMTVEHHRRVSDLAKADALLAEMEERLVTLQRDPRSALYRLAARTVLGLYADARDPQRLRDAFDRLRRSLGQTPNPAHAAELDRLQATLVARE